MKTAVSQLSTAPGFTRGERGGVRLASQVTRAKRADVTAGLVASVRHGDLRHFELVAHAA